MKKFLGKPNEKILKLKSLGRDALLYKTLPHFFLGIMHKYFRTKVEGVKNIPRRGPVIFTPNHSGFSGFDAMMLMHIIQKEKKILPKLLAHRLWFFNSSTSLSMKNLGFIEATKKSGENHLKKGHMIILFPEGEQGNFKPSRKAYELQEFKRGFVRMALEAQAPIIPTIIIGAEETHINLSQLKLSKYLRGLVLPLPFNIIPLPAKWKIKFLPPIHLPYKASAAKDSELVHEIAQDIREKLQKAINKELKKREHIYF